MLILLLMRVPKGIFLRHKGVPGFDMGVPGNPVHTCILNPVDDLLYMETDTRPHESLLQGRRRKAWRAKSPTLSLRLTADLF